MVCRTERAWGWVWDFVSAGVRASGLGWGGAGNLVIAGLIELFPTLNLCTPEPRNLLSLFPGP